MNNLWKNKILFAEEFLYRKERIKKTLGFNIGLNINL